MELLDSLMCSLAQIFLHFIFYQHRNNYYVWVITIKLAEEVLLKTIS